MSGWMCGAVTTVIAVLAGGEIAVAGIDSTVPAAAPAVASVSFVDAEFGSDLGAGIGAGLPAAPAGDDPLLAPVATRATPAAVPLPPGVVVGLVGLASAAVARRRYLRRH